MLPMIVRICSYRSFSMCGMMLQGKKQKQEEEARRRADKAPSALQRFFTS